MGRRQADCEVVGNKRSERKEMERREAVAGMNEGFGRDRKGGYVVGDGERREGH